MQYEVDRNSKASPTTMLLTSPAEYSNKRGEVKAGDTFYMGGPREVYVGVQGLGFKRSTFLLWRVNMSGELFTDFV